MYSIRLKFIKGELPYYFTLSRPLTPVLLPLTYPTMIRAQDVSKYYGAHRALGPVSFEIEEGETVGFLGLNGAGKTTALRVLAGDLRPSGGSISIGNQDVVTNPDSLRRKIGFLPESPPLYEDMTVEKFLSFAGKLRRMSQSDIDSRLKKVLGLTGLESVRQKLIGQLSSGFKQRVGVAQAIIHDPTLLILDEPTRSLDPVQIVEMREMIAALKEKHTVLISSHILTEISKTCDRLLVLGKGEILAEGTQEEIAQLFAPLHDDSLQYVDITIDMDGSSGEQTAIASLLGDIDSSAKVNAGTKHGNKVTYRVNADRDIRAAAAKTLVEAGYALVGLSAIESTGNLEDAFVELVKKGKSDDN